MNFLELSHNMLDEAIKMRKDFKAGKVSFDTFAAHMGGMAQIGKMVDRHLRLINFEKNNKISLRNVGVDMVGYDPENEMIDCPKEDVGVQVPRSECLDYSGTEKNMKACKKCDEFRATRKLLLPES